MKVVLLKDVPKFGKKYDVKEVSDGYGRNYLIKNSLAVAASDKTLAAAEVAKAKSLKDREVISRELDSLGDSLKGVEIKIKAKANLDGQLFAGIKKEDIILAVNDATGLKLKGEYLSLDKPIKKIGEHEIALNLPSGKSISFKLSIER